MPILLVSLGTSWAVVPEAFHALPPGPDGFSAVHVLTTASPKIDEHITSVRAWFAARHPTVELTVNPGRRFFTLAQAGLPAPPLPLRRHPSHRRRRNRRPHRSPLTASRPPARPIKPIVHAQRWPENHQVYLNGQPRTVSLDLYEAMQLDRNLQPFNP